MFQASESQILAPPIKENGIFQALESQILAPLICPPRFFSRTIAFPEFWKARFWHHPSVHPHWSRERSHFSSFGKPDFGTAHLCTPTFLENYRTFQASEGQILEPPICPLSIFSRNIAFPKLRKARFWHRPSVHPYFSQLISHFPGFGKLDFGTAHLSTPTFLLKDHIFQASESQILAPPICPSPTFLEKKSIFQASESHIMAQPIC